MKELRVHDWIIKINVTQCNSLPGPQDKCNGNLAVYHELEKSAL